MEISANQLLGWIETGFLIFVRSAAFISVLPILGTKIIPIPARIGLAAFITLIMYPFVTVPEYFDIFTIMGPVLLAQQVLIGMLMGFTIRIVFSALETGGYAIGQTMGLGFAQMLDPANGITVPVTSQIYTLFATLLFFAMNGHLIMLSILAESYSVMPIVLMRLSDIHVWSIIDLARWIFFGAVMIALPAVGALLVVNIAFGVMMRAAPQLNIFTIGFPVSLMLGFVFIYITLPIFIPQFQFLLETSIESLKIFIGSSHG